MKTALQLFSVSILVGGLMVSCSKPGTWECKCYEPGGDLAYHVSYFDAKKSEARAECNQVEEEYSVLDLKCKLSKD